MKCNLCAKNEEGKVDTGEHKYSLPKPEGKVATSHESSRGREGGER